MRGSLKFRFRHLQNALDIAENIVVPNPDCPVSEFPHRRIAFGVGRTVRMLAAIDLDHEVPLATCKIREIGSNRLLTHELETGKLPIAKCAAASDETSLVAPSEKVARTCTLISFCG